MLDSETAVIVNPPAGAHPDRLEVELVERKGRCHPDFAVGHAPPSRLERAVLAVEQA